MKPLLLLSLALSALVACTGGRGTAHLPEEPIDTIAFKYARLIHVEQYDDYRLVTIDNPWKPGKALHRYVLVGASEDTGASETIGTIEGTTIHVPLQKSIIFTSVHAALTAQLHAEAQVAGVADLKYIKVPFVQEGCRSGHLIDCGDGMNPLVEKIIDAQADAILLSPFENSGGYGRIEDVDIPLIECAEYMEASPLARAEWMRFYGMLYGREREADSLFAIVDSSYHALCLQAREAGKGRSVLVDKQTGSVWYVPGGRSTIGQMLVDAGAGYAFANDNHSGSLSLPFETVLERAGESDVWLFRYDASDTITLGSLLSEQPGYSQLRPVREKTKDHGRKATADGCQAADCIYGCNVATSMFYEETPFRPDLLLQDFIIMVHPEQASQLPPLRFYHPVNP